MKYLLKNRLHLKIACFVLFFVIVSKSNMAQFSFSAIGGNIAQSNGEISFTVGQSFFSYHSSESLTVSEGVQQPFEIFKVSGNSDAGINVNCRVFPNPIQGEMVLEYDAVYGKDKITHAVLSTIRGIIITKFSVCYGQTTVCTTNLPEGLYLLQVYQSNRLVKTFKVVKK
jgi:hypothetical protein